MSTSVKTKEQELTHEMLEGVIGKFVRLPENFHEIQVAEDKTKRENIWCAGKVAGFDVAYIGIDMSTGEVKEEITPTYSLLFCDGMAYTLANDCVLEVLTDDEFNAILEEHKAKAEAKKAEAEAEKARKSIELPDSKKIELPDNKIIQLPRS